MIDPHELDERLETAFPTAAPSADARTRALAAMQVALAGEPEPTTPPAGHRSTGSRLMRRLGVGALASALVLGPTAALAENAVPGDRLYPVKQVVETVQSLFDRDARAENRVDELRALTDRATRSELDTARAEERKLTEALAAARDAVVDRPVDATTRADFDRAEARAEAELERRLEEQRRREAERRAEEQRRRDSELREQERQQQDRRLQPDDPAPQTDSPTPQPDPTRDAPRDEPTREPEPEPTREPEPEPTREPEPEPTREPEPEPTRDDEPHREDETTRDQPSDEPTRDPSDRPRDDATPTNTARTIDGRTPRD